MTDRWIVRLTAALLLFAAGARAWAYPEFIGYGYASCVTCHYNGNGGGPLTDYGRALWSTTFASRALYPSSITDEQMGAQSGFLGSVELPFWLRPFIDYRGIEVRANPGGTTDKSKYYQMKTDIGLVLQNRSGDIAGVYTLGRVLPPAEFGQGKTGLDHLKSREYYVRGEFTKGWWLYGGLMEKVYGLRNIDHTSYQRTFQGFNPQNDSPDGTAESYGVILQKISKTWEASFNAFFGNPDDTPDYQQKGLSVMGEFEITDDGRLGASAMQAHSKVKDKQLVAIHYRQKIFRGSSLMAEYGLIKDKAPAAKTTVGSYDLVQAWALLARGYNLITTVERYNSEFRSSAADQWRWGLGLVMFPLPRFEFRVEAVNMRNFNGQTANDDSWGLQGQVHVAL